jgi:hypothetical protein
MQHIAVLECKLVLLVKPEDAGVLRFADMSLTGEFVF